MSLFIFCGETLHTHDHCFHCQHYVRPQPALFASLSIPKQYSCHGGNVVCYGSPSRIRRVRRSSLGMTTLPRSSMRRTIPVAFIAIPPNFVFRPGLRSGKLRRNWHSYSLQFLPPYSFFPHFATGGRSAIPAADRVPRQKKSSPWTGKDVRPPPAPAEKPWRVFVCLSVFALGTFLMLCARRERALPHTKLRPARLGRGASFIGRSRAGRADKFPFAPRLSSSDGNGQ